MRRSVHSLRPAKASFATPKCRFTVPLQVPFIAGVIACTVGCRCNHVWSKPPVRLTRAGRALVRVCTRDGLLRPAMYADVELEATRLADRVIVPAGR